MTYAVGKLTSTNRLVATGLLALATFAASIDALASPAAQIPTISSSTHQVLSPQGLDVLVNSALEKTGLHIQDPQVALSGSGTFSPSTSVKVAAHVANFGMQPATALQSAPLAQSLALIGRAYAYPMGTVNVFPMTVDYQKRFNGEIASSFAQMNLPKGQCSIGLLLHADTQAGTMAYMSQNSHLLIKDPSGNPKIAAAAVLQRSKTSIDVLPAVAFAKSLGVHQELDTPLSAEIIQTLNAQELAHETGHCALKELGQNGVYFGHPNLNNEQNLAVGKLLRYSELNGLLHEGFADGFSALTLLSASAEDTALRKTVAASLGVLSQVRLASFVSTQITTNGELHNFAIASDYDIVGSTDLALSAHKESSKTDFSRIDLAGEALKITSINFSNRVAHSFNGKQKIVDLLDPLTHASKMMTQASTDILSDYLYERTIAPEKASELRLQAHERLAALMDQVKAQTQTGSVNHLGDGFAAGFLKQHFPKLIHLLLEQTDLAIPGLPPLDAKVPVSEQKTQVADALRYHFTQSEFEVASHPYASEIRQQWAQQYFGSEGFSHAAKGLESAGIIKASDTTPLHAWIKGGMKSSLTLALTPESTLETEPTALTADTPHSLGAGGATNSSLSTTPTSNTAPGGTTDGTMNAAAQTPQKPFSSSPSAFVTAESLALMRKPLSVDLPHITLPFESPRLATHQATPIPNHSSTGVLSHAPTSNSTTTVLQKGPALDAIGAIGDSTDGFSVRLKQRRTLNPSKPTATDAAPKSPLRTPG